MSEEINEIWVSAKGFEGIYSVSSLGNVRREANTQGSNKQRLLKPYLLNNGYLCVSLSKKSKINYKTVHRLVYSSFIEDPLELDVCHNNGVRTDNRLENLRADTRKGNMADVLKHGTHIRGKRCGTNKYSVEVIAEFKKIYKEFPSIAEAARHFNIKANTAYSIANGHGWKWL